MAISTPVDLDYSLNKLANSKGDAFKNIFEIQIVSAPFELGVIPSVLLEGHRVSAVTIPESSVGTTGVRIRGTIVSKLSGTISQGNDLSFEIRVDNQWDVYKFFYDWRELYGDRKFGLRKIYDDKAREKGKLSVLVESANGKTGKWDFHDVILVGLGEVAFDASIGDPVTVNLQFKFSYYDFNIVA